MPTRTVEVIEYECAKCGYKWINYKNGVQGPKPVRCSKCKRWDWEEGNLSHFERRIRKKIINLESGIWGYGNSWTNFDPFDRVGEVCWNFLYNIEPRATQDELAEVANIGDEYDSPDLKEQNRQKRHEVMQRIISQRKTKGYDYKRRRYYRDKRSEYYRFTQPYIVRAARYEADSPEAKKIMEECPFFYDWLAEKEKTESYEDWLSKADRSLSRVERQRQQ